MSICKSFWMSRVISRVFRISVCVPFFPIKSSPLELQTTLKVET